MCNLVFEIIDSFSGHTYIKLFAVRLERRLNGYNFWMYSVQLSVSAMSRVEIGVDIAVILVEFCSVSS